MHLDRPTYSAIAGRTVIVTGAANGIGRALASNYAAGGAVVVAVDRDDDGLRTLASAEIETLVGDVTHP